MGKLEASQGEQSEDELGEMRTGCSRKSHHPEVVGH